MEETMRTTARSVAGATFVASVTIAANARAQQGVDPFTAPPIFPSGISRLPNLPAATADVLGLRQVRCAIVPRIRSTTLADADLAYTISPHGDPPPAVAPLLRTALTAHGWDLAQYRHALATLEIATNFHGKSVALQRVARAIGIPAWERCGYPDLTARPTQDCIRARGDDLIAGLSPTAIIARSADEELITANLHDTVFWLTTMYCTWFSEAYQIDWAAAAATMQSSPITWLLEHPQEFCDGVKTIAQEGFCTLLMRGPGIDTVPAKGLQTACRALTGPAYDVGAKAGNAIGRLRNRNFLERAEHGVAVAGIAFDLTAFGCKRLLKGTCTWLTEAPARAERDRCVADIVRLRTELSDPPPARERSIEALERMLNERGATLEER